MPTSVPSDTERSFGIFRMLDGGGEAVKPPRGDSASGNDAERAPAVDAVGLEVVVVDGKDHVQLLPLGQVNQGGIREVHGTVAVAVHQGLKISEILITDGAHDHRFGMDEIPSCTEIAGLLQKKVEEFRKDRR